MTTTKHLLFWALALTAPLSTLPAQFGGNPMEEIKEIADAVDKQLKEIDRLLLESGKKGQARKAPKEMLEQASEGSKIAEDGIDKLIEKLSEMSQQSSSSSSSAIRRASSSSRDSSGKASSSKASSKTAARIRRRTSSSSPRKASSSSSSLSSSKVKRRRKTDRANRRAPTSSPRAVRTRSAATPKRTPPGTASAAKGQTNGAACSPT